MPDQGLLGVLQSLSLVAGGGVTAGEPDMGGPRFAEALGVLFEDLKRFPILIGV